MAPDLGSGGAIVVEAEHRQWRIACRREGESRRADAPTEMQLRYHPAASALWICTLHVAGSERLTGVGRALLRAAEQVASTVGARAVHVFPIGSAGGFWRRMGYEPHEVTVRVLSKRLADAGQPSVARSA